MRRIFFLLIFIFVCAVTGWADVIIFRNGDRLTGKFVKLEKNKMTFEADEIGKITLDIASIKNFSAEIPAKIHFIDGTIIKSKILLSDPNQFSIEKTDLLSAHTFNFSDLAAINPPPKPKPKWTGSATLGISSSHGNTFAESTNVNFDAKRRSQMDRTHIYSNYLASRSRDPDSNDKKTTEESFVIGGKYDYFFTKKFYGFTNGSFKKDHIADLDHRIIVGIGVGYQWIDTDNMTFSTDAGLAQLCEQYTSPDSATGLKITTSTDEASIQFGYNFDYKINDKFTFVHKLTYYPSFSSPSDYFLTTNAELRAFITKAIFSSFRVVIDYDSTPADDVGTTDTKYILGAGWNF